MPSPHSPTSTILNPFAPEYHPIAPPPYAATFHRHCPPPQSFFSHYNLTYTYIPSSQPLPPFYTSSYPAHTPHGPPPPPPPPLPPPPPPPLPYAEATTQGWTRREPRERGRGRGRAVWRCKFEKLGRGFDMNRNGVGCNEKKRLILKKGMQRSDVKTHKVMPINMDEPKTTIMIKNIPYDCSRKEVIRVLDEFCSIENDKLRKEGTSRKQPNSTCAYDFVYLPIDFRTKRSRGFAFVNFTDSRAVSRCFRAFNLQKWDFVHSINWSKKIEIVSASIQGMEALNSHFENSNFECETDEFLPARFSPARDGSGQAVKLTVVGNRRAPPARGGGAT